MQIGTLLTYRHSGHHKTSTLVVLHNNELNQRILYNINLNCLIGEIAALYAKPTGEIAPNNEIAIYYKRLNINQN